MRKMLLPNRHVDGLRMVDFLRKRGVPAKVDRTGNTVFLPEMTRLQALAWHVRKVLTRAFGIWAGADVKVMKENTDVVVTFTDLFSGNSRIVAVPTDGAHGTKFYQVHDGSQRNWVPEQIWQDFAETVGDLANVGDLEEQVCHPAVPPELRREILVQGVFFEGLLSPEQYITVRHYNGEPLRASEDILPVETIRPGQTVDRCFLSDGRNPEAEIVVGKDGVCQIRYRRSMVSTDDGRLMLVVSENSRPWVGKYQRVPAVFRDAAEQAYRAVAPVPDMADKIGEKMLEKLEATQ